jgi:hypothetical protein
MTTVAWTGTSSSIGGEPCIVSSDYFQQRCGIEEKTSAIAESMPGASSAGSPGCFSLHLFLSILMRGDKGVPASAQVYDASFDGNKGLKCRSQAKKSMHRATPEIVCCFGFETDSLIFEISAEKCAFQARKEKDRDKRPMTHL